MTRHYCLDLLRVRAYGQNLAGHETIPRILPLRPLCGLELRPTRDSCPVGRERAHLSGTADV